MDYSRLSDFEINLKVAHIVLGKGSYDCSSEKKEVYSAGIDGGEFLPNGYFDPCNNPADAWPIIVKNKISIISMYSGKDCWQVDAGEDEEFVLRAQDNPLRAAMIVFLMMQDSANVPDNSTGSDLR